MHLGQHDGLLLICEVPYRHSVFQWLIYAEEEVDYALSVRITEVIGQVAFDTRDELRGDGEHALFLAKLSMMCNRTTILKRDLISHSIIHPCNDFEKLGFHLDVDVVVRQAQLFKLPQANSISDNFLAKISSI